MLFKCKWCSGTYKAAATSRANLFKHRDGDQNHPHCPGRKNAIANGSKLSITKKEKQANESSKEKNSLQKFLQNGKYDNRALK